MAHGNDKGIKQHGKGRRDALLDTNLNSCLAHTSKFPLEKECHISRLDRKERKKYTVGECMVSIKIWVLAAFHFHIITIKPNFYYTSHRLKNKCTCNTLIFHVIKLLGKSFPAFKSPDRTIRAGLIEAAESSIPLPLFEGGMYLFSAEPTISSLWCPASLQDSCSWPQKLRAYSQILSFVL